jgi:hypothetical protein
LSAPVLNSNFSGNEGKILTFKPAQKSAGLAINMLENLAGLLLEILDSRV